MHVSSSQLPWLSSGQAFPPASKAWGTDDPAPGLLAAGGDLSAQTLQAAYRQGIFPWFSPGQPILWWSPDPRMVLRPDQFKVSRSLRKTLLQFSKTATCEIRVDHDFSTTVRACAQTRREGQNGTWIVPEMITAYEALHGQGLAHSVETWIDGELVGGLYFVSLGAMVYGESMFTRRRDASKIALSALVAMCQRQRVDLIDCQQNTVHLASLGASELARTVFLDQVAQRVRRQAITWSFEPLYWSEIV